MPRLFQVYGMIGVNKINVMLDIEVQRRKDEKCFGAFQIRRVEDGFDLGPNVRLVQPIKRFQRPHNLGNDQKTGGKVFLPTNSLAKQRFRPFGFYGIVLSEESKKDVGINKQLSHAEPLWLPRPFSRIAGRPRSFQDVQWLLPSP